MLIRQTIHNQTILKMNKIEKRVMGKNGDEIIVNISESAEIRLKQNEIVRSEYRMEDVEIKENEEVYCSRLCGGLQFRF